MLALIGAVPFFLLGTILFSRFSIPGSFRKKTAPVEPPSPSKKSFLIVWRENRKRRKTIEAVGEVFPQALEIAIQALKAGQTVAQTLEYLSQEAAPPLRDEFALVCREMAWGTDAEEALGRLAQRVPQPDIARFQESYRLSRQTGANLTHLLQTLLEGMEERNRLSRRMESMTAQARLSGLLMGSLPIFLIVILFLMDPLLMAPLFTTFLGWGILAVAALLETIGFIWIRGLMMAEV